jgi:hypothetical protein
MSVTAIIPLYNKERYIERALRSVLAQTRQADRILVVDDGSTDRSAAIVRRFQDPRIELIAQTNRGPGAARNRGISEAQTEFVAFLDADDCWSAEYLEHGMKRFSELGAEVATVTCGYRLFPCGTSTAELWRRRRISAGVHRITAASDPRWCVHLLAYLSPCTTIARTRIVRRFGGFYQQDHCVYGEDSYLWLQVLFNAPVATLLIPLVDIHSEASTLGSGAQRTRPIEPLLTATQQLFGQCPFELHSLLSEILAKRALKTAAVMGYWGKWRDGRALLRQFVSPKSSNFVHRLAAHVCASPVGSGLGLAHRAIARRRRFAREAD